MQSWPWADLRVDERQARIRLTGFARAGEVTIDRSEVVAVRGRRAILGRGICFMTNDGHLDGVTFWPVRPSVVLRELRDLGWPVDE